MACAYCNIKDLTMNAKSFFINALIIAKTQINIFSGRGVITFTIRDTKDHFINVAVWGDEKYIENCDRAYKIGDVVSVYNPQVKQKNAGSVYHPRTTSPFELVMNDSKACIHRVNDGLENLLRLRNHSVKPTNLVLRLNDLDLNIDSVPLSVDLVVLVRAVGPVQTVQTSKGPKNIRKVYVMDTTMENISMTVWHDEYQERMNNWKPLQTVLHLVDVRAAYSDFERSTTLTVTTKTIIVENPVGSSRSNEILEYIHGLSLDKIDELKSIQVKRSVCPESITDVMTVKRILDEIDRNGSKDVAAIVYGVITHFRITSALVKSCANCRQMLFPPRTECEKEGCVNMEHNERRFIDRFYMKVSLADHSGTLDCHIKNFGEKILGHTTQELKEMTEDDLDNIHEKFNLERFGIKVIVRPKNEAKYSAEIVSIDVKSSDVIEKALKL